MGVSTFGFFLFILAIGAIGGAIAFGRALKQRGEETRTRVAVTAYVVKFTHYRNPARVTFDYPLPDGTWARASRTAAFMDYSLEKRDLHNTFRIDPGFKFPVYVNPTNPLDVSLSATTSAGTVGMFVGLVMCIIAALGCLMGLGLLASWVYF